MKPLKTLKRLSPLQPLNSLSSNVVGRILRGVKQDIHSKNMAGHTKLATEKQMRDAAYDGVWTCHGHRLEPDATCPKCGREVF